MKPEEIEALSFKIIDREAGQHRFCPDKWSIVQRMIHTSADFEYLDTVRFHPDAVNAGINAICSGKPVITDTNMVKAGINKSALERFNVDVRCFINDPEVKKQAQKAGTTRSQTAVDAAIDSVNARDFIFVIGNAPTALMRLIELVKKNMVKPALIIGFPVGFVNAKESKEALLEIPSAYITNISRKGGSNIAASVVNALVKLAVKKIS